MTCKVPTSLSAFPSSSHQHCSFKRAYPTLFYSAFNGFRTSKRGEKTLSLHQAAKYSAATLLKNIYKIRR